MKRAVVSAMAVVLAFAVCSVSLAGPGGKDPKQAAAKKSLTGTITVVDVKQQTVTVAPPAAGEQTQIQTQGKVEQKGKTPAVAMVFKVDAKTVITVPGAQQGQANPGFQALKKGQMVRVVYADGDAKPGKGAKGAPAKPAAPAAQADQKQGQKQEQSVQQTTPKKPVAEQAGAKKPAADQAAPKKVIVALSIEILAQSGAQQNK